MQKSGTSDLETTSNLGGILRTSGRVASVKAELQELLPFPWEVIERSFVAYLAIPSEDDLRIREGAIGSDIESLFGATLGTGDDDLGQIGTWVEVRIAGMEAPVPGTKLASATRAACRSQVP